MRGRERLEAYLREQGVRFEVIPHPEAYTAQEVAAAEHVPGRQFAKVVIAEADGKHVMLVLPASARVDLVRLRAALEWHAVRLRRKLGIGLARARKRRPGCHAVDPDPRRQRLRQGGCGGKECALAQRV